jgi:hypothetical protein
MRVTGGQVFRDEDSIPPATRWREVLASALTEADVVVVFWSCHSATSKEVSAEWKRAQELGKAVLPVLLDDTPMPHELTAFQYLDFRFVAVGYTWLATPKIQTEKLMEAIGLPILIGRTGGLDHELWQVAMLASHRVAKDAAVFKDELEHHGFTVTLLVRESTVAETDRWFDQTTLERLSRSGEFLTLTGSKQDRLPEEDIYTLCVLTNRTRPLWLVDDPEFRPQLLGDLGEPDLQFHNRSRIVDWLLQRRSGDPVVSDDWHEYIHSKRQEH